MGGTLYAVSMDTTSTVGGDANVDLSLTRSTDHGVSRRRGAAPLLTRRALQCMFLVMRSLNWNIRICQYH